MQPHQSFTDLCVIALTLTTGKICMMLAQVVTPADAALIDKITGPFGALVAMAIGIWYLSLRNKKMDAKLEERQKIQDAKDAENLKKSEESTRVMTEALVKTSMIVEQNQRIIERCVEALDNHPCTDES
jgi:hypothetical protein